MPDGIIIIDKPAGWTSHDVVARVRRLFNEKRVGHTGTLDPFATGVLVLLVGRATRLAQFLAGDVKEYEALVRLGYATETGDATGARRARTGEVEEIAAGNCAGLDAAQIESALAALRGETEQVPPMYSAKKVKGRKLYELARRGAEIERAPVRVTVHEFEIVPRQDGELLRHNDDGTCDFAARVVCSAGTYVRVLAESVGESLDTGAHLAALRRTRAGEFRLDSANTLDELKTKLDEGSEVNLLSMDAALSRMAFVHLTGEEASRARHGAAVAVRAPEPLWQDGERVRLRDGEGNLLAVASYDEPSGLLRPRVMLAAEENKH